MNSEVNESMHEINKCNNKYVSILETPNLRGGAIRDIAKGLLEISDGLHSYFNVKVIVLDTNIILNDLKHIVTKQVASTLYEEAEMEFTRLFITPSVAEEVVEKIPKFSENTRIDSLEMYEAWDAYKKNLIVFNPEAASCIDRLNQLKQRDPDDVPTAELIELVAPNLALSMDKDLKTFGYAQTGSWLDYVLSTSNIITDESIQIIFTFCTSALFAGISEGLKWITHALKKVPKRTAAIALSGLSISTIMLLADARSRKWLSSKIKNLKNLCDSQLKDQIAALVKQFEEHSAITKVSKEQVKSGKPNFEEPKHLRYYVIQVLTKSHRPLSITQLMESVIKLGYDSRGANPEKYLHQILSKDPMFIKNDVGLWSLNIQNVNGFKVVISE